MFHSDTPRWFRVMLWVTVVTSLAAVYAGSWLLVL